MCSSDLFVDGRGVIDFGTRASGCDPLSALHHQHDSCLCFAGVNWIPNCPGLGGGSTHAGIAPFWLKMAVERGGRVYYH